MEKWTLGTRLRRGVSRIEKKYLGRSSAKKGGDPETRGGTEMLDCALHGFARRKEEGTIVRTRWALGGSIVEDKGEASAESRRREEGLTPVWVVNSPAGGIGSPGGRGNWFGERGTVVSVGRRMALRSSAFHGGGENSERKYPGGRGKKGIAPGASRTGKKRRERYVCWVRAELAANGAGGREETNGRSRRGTVSSSQLEEGRVM